MTHSSILTSRQAQVLEFINSKIALDGYPPTMREIAKNMGIRSNNGVHDHLLALERKGYISRGRTAARAIRVLERADKTVGNAVARFGIVRDDGTALAAEAVVEGDLTHGQAAMKFAVDDLAGWSENDEYNELLWVRRMSPEPESEPGQAIRVELTRNRSSEDAWHEGEG